MLEQEGRGESLGWRPLAEQGSQGRELHGEHATYFVKEAGGCAPGL